MGVQSFQVLQATMKSFQQENAIVNFDLNHAALPAKGIRAIVQAKDISAMKRRRKAAPDDPSPNSGKQYFFHVSGTHVYVISYIWAVL